MILKLNYVCKFKLSSKQIKSWISRTTLKTVPRLHKFNEILFPLNFCWPNGWVTTKTSERLHSNESMRCWQNESRGNEDWVRERKRNDPFSLLIVIVTLVYDLLIVLQLLSSNLFDKMIESMGHKAVTLPPIYYWDWERDCSHNLTS